MPHDACSVKLRPGATGPRNVKLYPWTVAGSLDITSLESGVGADVIRVHKVIVVVDSGAGSESVLKQIRIIVIVTDAGTGTETLTLQKPQIETLSSELRFYLTQLREVKTIEAILRIHATVVDEGSLSVSGEPWNIEGAFIYGIGLSENLRSVKLGDQQEVTPRLGSASAIPRGWSQGHKSHPISVFTNGRSSILDEYLAESGDSSEIELLDLRCLDKDGEPSNIFLKNAVVVRADPLALEGGDVVYRYDLVCDHWTMRPEMHVLKMVSSTVAAPLMIIITHPEMPPISTVIEVFTAQDYEETMLLESSLSITEAAPRGGSGEIESSYEASVE